MLPFISISIVIAINAVALSIYFSTKSVLEPTLWTEPFALPKLVGPLTPNTILNATEKLYKGICLAPESIAIDIQTGDMYGGLSDGRVVMMSPNGDLVKTVFFTGGYVLREQDLKGNGIGSDTSRLMNWCLSEALNHELAWNIEGERSCGRPLGLRLLRKVVI